MGKKSVLRKLVFPSALFDALAEQINEEIIQTMDLKNVPAKRLDVLRKFAKNVDIDKLEALDEKIEKTRAELRALSNEDRNKRQLSEEEIMDGLRAKLTCPDRIRKSICDILIQSARTAAVMRKERSLEKENAERKKNGQKPLKAAMSPEDFEITAGMRREFYRAIVQPEDGVGEVKLDDEEWSLLSPIWDDKGEDKHAWEFGVYTEACVLAIKNEIIDKAAEIDMKA